MMVRGGEGAVWSRWQKERDAEHNKKSKRGEDRRTAKKGKKLGK